MITLRRSAERGHAQHGWLDSYHTFSFADYYDPQQMGFRALRVINQDRVQAGNGFPAHPHRDMEILSYVLEGALEHKDSMGSRSVLRPGEAQLISAGTGMMHSEYNPSQTDPVHFLQVWVVPDKRGLLPTYEQKEFPAAERRGRLRLIASPNGEEESTTIHQDARVYASLLGSGERATLQLSDGRHAWVHVARGEAKVNGVTLSGGDGAALSDEPRLALEGVDDAELLVFDLA